MAVPFVLWTVTGLLFHLKPGWDRAYDMLSERSGGAIAMDQVVLPAVAVAAAGTGPVTRIELFPSALGPVYRIDRGGEVTLLDATTGVALSPLDGDTARAIVVEAVARSAHASAYGTVKHVAAGEREVTVQFTGGPVVRVDRASARLSQRGADTDRIDWLYRVHYVQWTGVAWLDRALSLTAIGGTWLVAGLGLALFFWRGRARSARL